MACRKIFFLIALMLAVSLANAVDFSVVDTTGDTPGGRRFREEIGGVSYGEQSLRSATDFVWRLFRQTNPSDRKSVTKITLFMQNRLLGDAFSYGNEIHYNADSLADHAGDVRREFTGAIYREVVHSLQWNGAGHAPEGLVVGVADYVRLKAGYVTGDWVRPGGGDRWDQGYDVTARFLEYCNSLKSCFVAELNHKMKAEYRDGFFVDLLGKDVNQLWREYKAKYGQ